MKWAEFADWNVAAQNWVSLGNIAIVPYLIHRVGGGESRYMLAHSRKIFVAACEELGTKPSDFPRDRSSINIDGAYLMRAIVFCRRDAGQFVGTVEPWKSECPTCGLPFFIVADHTIGELVTSTSAACADGHRWPV